ncbi:hypothetical protein GCM10027048_13280 [Hymenobacter coalescens]
MIYLLLALLFVVTSGARDAMMSMFNSSREYFWYALFLIGAGLLLLQLLTENAYTVALRRNMLGYETKINELKAKLYDHQLEQRDRDLRTVGGTTVPRPEPAPGSIPRGSVVPPPSAADLPPSLDPPTTNPSTYPTDRPAV